MCENQSLAVEEIEYTNRHEELSLFDILSDCCLALWSQWPEYMKVSQYSEKGFILRGQCPHCEHLASFPTVTTPFQQQEGTHSFRWVAAARCEACNEYILAIVRFDTPMKATPFVTVPGVPPWLEKYFPIGTPSDYVAEEVPLPIREDFAEALRCNFIKSWKATVLMCRRALQASCDTEKADGNDLYTQIDFLAKRQRITEPLRKMAHRIRLLGKKGAHGDYSDIDDTITANDAEDAVKFMRHYLEHVYVLPAQLDGPVTASEE